MAAKAQKSNTSKLKASEKKWGKTLLDAGWTLFPNILLEKQAALGLKAIEVNILMHLLTYWWDVDNTPHPSKQRMATALGVSTKTIQRNIASLETAGFIKREPQFSGSGGGQTSNRYNFDGLIMHATEFAEEKLGLRDRHKAEDDERRRRRGRPKPKIVAVNGKNKDER